jgi:hypothetical protein
MPIANVQLVAIASTAVLRSQQYPHATKDWEALKALAKTWTTWKKVYRAAHIAHKCQLLATGSAKPFGSANVAGYIPPNGTMDRLDGYLNNLAKAAMQDKSMFAQLVDNNVSLTKSFEAPAAAYTTLAGKPAPMAAPAATHNALRWTRAAHPVNY